MDVPLRPCVGAVIFDRRGRVWLGERAGVDGPYNWQFPQGGIDKGEGAEHALWRELLEEINLHPQDATILDRVDRDLAYILPEEHRRPGRKWIGQRQTWFALRFKGKDSRFRFDREDPPEFAQWKWTDFHEAVTHVVPFKREVYETIAGRFWKWAG